MYNLSKKYSNWFYVQDANNIKLSSIGIYTWIISKLKISVKSYILELKNIMASWDRITLDGC